MASDSSAKRIAEGLGSARLSTRNGDSFELVITEMRAVRARAGWLQFALTVRDPNGLLARTPLMTGIISGGGRGVMPWIEGRIDPWLEMANGQHLDGREAGLEAELINLIGALIPAGGHLMIEYESPAHRETHHELLLQVPPAATHLGALMFAAGFRGHFKDWYISEGGHEGPRKLQANKSPNTAAATEAMRANFEQLEQFTARPLPEDADHAGLIDRAKARAHTLLTAFGGRRG